MIPLIPVVIVTGLGVAFVRAKKKKMTPERKKLFESALLTMNDPAKLNKLADIFQKDGLRAEAEELRKRAKVIGMPAAKKEEYRNAYKKGMKSTDPAKVKNLAQSFHSQGFYGSAKNLRDYAAGLVDNLKAHMPTTSTAPIGSSDASMPPATHSGGTAGYGGEMNAVETEGVEISGAG